MVRNVYLPWTMTKLKREGGKKDDVESGSASAHAEKKNVYIYTHAQESQRTVMRGWRKDENKGKMRPKRCSFDLTL